MPFESSRIQPLVPSERSVAPLLEQAAALVAEGHLFEAVAGSLADTVRPLLVVMNSYYTNKIEGQHTRPADIQRALDKQFDADEKNARKQRLALAHVKVELELGARLFPDVGDMYRPEFVREIHERLYAELPLEDRVGDDGATIVPGALRAHDVTAGRHLAPPWDEVPRALDVWRGGYRQLPGVEQALVGAVCSHHRVLWIHPFADGNGRVARLHTHFLLGRLGVSRGLWSPLRGMAHSQTDYYARLNNADLPRRNDLDGRGSLSQEELVNFASWLLDTCLDQATFMREMLGLTEIKARINDLLTWLESHPWQIGSEKSVVKPAALEAVHYIAISGSVERSRFVAMTGLPERTARRVLASLLDFGLLKANGPRGPVRFGVPVAGLRFLFPRLWPEAE